MLQLLRWEQGDFKFYSGEEVAFEEGFYAISIEELLIRSLSDLGDDGQVGGPPDLAVAYERVPGAPPIRTSAQDGPPREGSGVWIAAEDRPLVERLDGKTPVGALADATGVGHYRALFTLYKLLRAGAVRAVPARAQGGAAAPPAAPGPGRPAAHAPASASRGAAPAAATAPVTRPVPPPTFGAPARDAASEEELPEVAAAAPAGTGPHAPDGGRAPVPTATRVSRRWPCRGSRRWRVALAVFAAALAGAAPAAAALSPGRSRRAPASSATSAVPATCRSTAPRAPTSCSRGTTPTACRSWSTCNLLAPSAARRPGGAAASPTRPRTSSYEVQPVVGGEPMAELGVREAITGDFLLDPDFLDLPEKPDRPPLVLLD